MIKEKESNIERVLQKKADWLRRRVLAMTVKAKAGHVAPSFSCAEILTAIYYGGYFRVRPKDPHWADRDIFILSKGQAAVALYAILADLGFFPLSELMTFTQKGSRLGGHTENTIPGVEAFTGSLGHGICIAAGVALAFKRDGKKSVCISLLGDGECHEGSVWEAVMFASQHRLNNLCAIIDHNGLSATDFLEDYLSVAPLKDKFEAFGWEVETVDGHSIGGILSVVRRFRERVSKKPLAVIAKTTKGKGVSFMENKPIWHYRIPVGRELEMARKELSCSCLKKRRI